MQKIVTEQERKLLYRHFMRVVKNDPLLSSFPRRAREIFADRMVEIEKARIEERDTDLKFPPEGFEITLYPKKPREPVDYSATASGPSHPLPQDGTDVRAL